MLKTVLILAAILIGLVVIIKWRKKKASAWFPDEPEEPVYLFKDVYDYFKETGYLNLCREYNYKFSTQRLEKIMKKEPELRMVNIDFIDECKQIPGVGKKVFELIQHLVIKFNKEVRD